jgi:transposase
VRGGIALRYIGLDVHREFAQVAMLEDGTMRHLGRITATPEALHAFARTLGPHDQVALEATCNTYAIARLLQQHAGRVIVSNPVRTRAIAEAKIKTDKVDAEALVRLLASGWLPEVWLPDDQTQTFRQQVAHRARLVQQQTRLKNRIQGILHRNLVLGCPRSDLFGKGGRQWLTIQATPRLPQHEQATVEAALRELDVVHDELVRANRLLASWALDHADVRRLLTIPGVDATVALALVAAIGDVHRFASPAKLVGYLGLDPRVRQSGARPASYGPITKQGRAHARGALVEAAWAAVKTPGPLRACYHRIRARRGPQIAVVAVARKLAVLTWHLLTRGEDYAFARPSFIAKKLRTLELRAGRPAQRGRRGSAYAYFRNEARQRELEIGMRAERAYQRLTAHWQVRPKRKDASAPNGKRR